MARSGRLVEPPHGGGLGSNDATVRILGGRDGAVEVRQPEKIRWNIWSARGGTAVRIKQGGALLFGRARML